MLGNVTVPRSVTYRLRAFGPQAFFFSGWLSRKSRFGLCGAQAL
jgi:hypothetical protein